MSRTTRPGFGRGVFRYDGANIARFSRQDGLGSDIVQTIMQDRAGVLWFGTRDGGLNRYDGEPIAPAQIEARIGQLAREA